MIKYFHEVNDGIFHSPRCHLDPSSPNKSIFIHFTNESYTINVGLGFWRMEFNKNQAVQWKTYSTKIHGWTRAMELWNTYFQYYMIIFKWQQ